MAFKDIPFNSQLHGKLVQAIRDRANLSRRKWGERFPAFQEAEKRMMAYVPAKDAERAAKRQDESAEFTQIEIPMIYAMVLTAHTYHTSVFLSRDPVLQVAGRHGEGQQNVLAHEALLSYQMGVGKHMPVYFTWLLDVEKYGVGIVGTQWKKEVAQIAEFIDAPLVKDGIAIPGRTEKQRVTRRGTVFEGNSCFNVRPADFLPDPRVSLQNFQEGEFCGRHTRISWNQYLKGHQNRQYQNMEAMKQFRVPQQNNSTLESGYGLSGDNPALTEIEKNSELLNVRDTKRDKNMLDIVEMHIEIVPKDWELGESTYPEMWSFTLANDRVLIGAQPMGLMHASFPFEVLEQEVDGYGLSSRGLFEIGEPLAQTMDWLANSHFYNVQKALNNEYVVDPSMVMMKDFTDPRPGKIIRLKPAAYGKDPRNVIHQIPAVDYTRTHLQDMRVVEGLFQRVFGINESLLGATQSTGRKSATEVRQSSTFGISRLKSQAEWFSATGWTGLTKMFIQNNQQLYSQEQKFRIAGNNLTQQGAASFVDVTPESLMGFYDFVPVDGTLPVDRFAQASLWKEIFSQIRNMPPQVAAGYDWAAVFAWMAKLAGLKNIDMFKVQPQVSPMGDAALEDQVKRGNLVPLQEAQNGRGAGASEIGEGGVAGAPQVSGVGPVG